MYLYKKVGDDLEKKRNIKCSSCEYGKYLEHFDTWTCEHTECKDAVFFKGKTHPHACPLVGGKKYQVHKNVKNRYDVRFKYW